jgi:hypothetical protein
MNRQQFWLLWAMVLYALGVVETLRAGFLPAFIICVLAFFYFGIALYGTTRRRE